MNRGLAVKYLVYAMVLSAIAYFFVQALQKNWHNVREHQFLIDPLNLSLGLITLFATYLIATVAWHRSINTLSAGPRLSWTHSVAAVNSSNLVKYLPGKVWTYTLQLYWLSKAGFSKSLVTYVNIINLGASITTTLICGLLLLLFTPNLLAPELTLAALAMIVAIDLVCIKFQAPLFRWGVTLAQRFLKRDLRYYEPSARTWLEIHALHLLAAIAFALCAYFTARGIGYPLPLRDSPRIMTALLLADLVGFVAVFAPGGLGVREGLMYVMLGGASSGSLALVLPLSIRMLNMLVDLTLGGFALHLSRSFGRTLPSGRPPAQEIGL